MKKNLLMTNENIVDILQIVAFRRDYEAMTDGSTDTIVHCEIIAFDMLRSMKSTFGLRVVSLSEEAYTWLCDIITDYAMQLHAIGEDAAAARCHGLFDICAAVK